MRDFVPLTAFLRPPRLCDVPFASDLEDAAAGDAMQPADVQTEAGYEQTIGACRRFQAGLADAIDAGVVRLLAEVAENVLARELMLRSADLASIVAKAQERLLDERIVAVRVHPSDRDALSELQLEKVGDTSLRPGDIVLELRSGTIDLRLRARVEAALGAACNQ